jgi:O-antigen ligase
VSTLLKLSLLYVILIAWMKAGHADGIGSVILIGLGSMVMVFYICSKNFWERNSLILHLPILALTIISVISYQNPRYRVITHNDLFELKFEEVLLNSNNPFKIEMMSKSVNLILDSAKSSPSTSISLFFHFKSTYRDKFGSKKSDPILNFFDELNQRLKIPFHTFLPSSIVQDTKILKRNYLFLINLVIGIVIYTQIKKQNQIDKIALLFVLNFLILCIVGIYQKYTQQWTDHYLEILGIWDAPEPRYYFSTFTYKNHWSAFAIMMLSFTFFILIRILKEINFDYLKSGKLFFYIFALIIGSSTIFYSGSRSGTILLILLLMFNFIFISRKRFITFKKILLVTIFLPFILFITYQFSQDKKWKEMVSNSESQLQNLKAGNAPLRWFFWKDTLEIIRDKPLWGHGYLSFSSIYPKFQSYEVRHERSLGLENAHNEYIPLVAHAHNDLLEHIVEWGLVGIFLVFLPFLYLIPIGIFQKSSHSLFILSVGCVIFLIYCAVDFPSRTPACLANFSVLVAMSQKYRVLRSKIPSRI